ncbi:MAG TPA: dienelactone hydrolase family protein [Terriglobia bacterium]|nr:dienelactone hydrolase family protein [Terriglobia bacterium]
MKKTSRRGFLGSSVGLSLGLGLAKDGKGWNSSAESDSARPVSVQRPTTSAPSTLPGTTPLTATGDLAAEMVDGIHKHLLRATAESFENRPGLWNRDFRSARDYEESIAPQREQFRKLIGAVDRRVPQPVLQVVAATTTVPEIAGGSRFKTYTVRWTVCDSEVGDYSPLEGEGLLLEPLSAAVARVVAVPDADCSPEALVGLAPGVLPAAQFARRLAENGCQVIVPVLINRGDDWSGINGITMTNQPHREWIYRMAFEVGRHIIGFEVQKILAAVDWLDGKNKADLLPVGVFGYGEGGLLAFYAAALDNRIRAAAVSGYFQSRQELWKEPIYRDLWGVLLKFGDAEIAGMVAPRALIVEACAGPHVEAVPTPEKTHANSACPNGKLVTPSLEDVQAEVERARPLFAQLKATGQLQLVVSNGGQGPPGSEKALAAFLRSLGVKRSLHRSEQHLIEPQGTSDPRPRLHRQFDQMVAFTQGLIRLSPRRRADFWAGADRTSIEQWKKTTKRQREYVWEEVIGRRPAATIPPNPRTRLVYETPDLAGYDVCLDVWPDVLAYGILVLPKNIKPGERRPVVVCQHGLEGRPSEAADPGAPDGYMHHFAVELAHEGFVTFAPQNPYIGEDNFRIIQRLAHPLKLALFSFIIGQHERVLEWLSGQPYVDAKRIAFYGISYGGKTAVRVPPFVERYTASICTADFNEWVWKTTSVESPYSYLLLPEYDMYEFDFANVVNYAELAMLIAPRPFMVERGHDDGVAPDEWVASEYARVRQFYAEMGIPQNTAIEWWNGPHAIHGVGTFEFLRRHLQWPGRSTQEG